MATANDDSTTKPAAQTRTGRAAAERDVETVANDIESLRDDIVRLSKTLSTLVQTQAVSAKDTMTEKAGDIYDTAETQVRSVADDVSRRVEANPLAAIGIVFGVGYILGLLRRR